MVGAEPPRDLPRVARARCSARSLGSATEKVLTGSDVSSDISATLVELSTPPERNTPNGTSLIMRLAIEARSSSSSRSLELVLAATRELVDHREDIGVQ